MKNVMLSFNIENNNEIVVYGYSKHNTGIGNEDDNGVLYAYIHINMIYSFCNR